MSTDGVRIVGELLPPPDRDLAALYRDDSSVAILMDAMAASFDPAVQTRVLAEGNGGSVNTGMDGLRKTWLELLESWQSYRSKILRVIDVGESVLVVSDDYVRRADEEEEDKLAGAAIWTLRGGKVTAIDFYTDREQAFKDAAARRAGG